MILPGQYNDVCEDLISVYVVEIIGAIQQGLDENQLCEFIGICMEKQETASKLSQLKYKTSVVCETCTEVSLAIGKVLGKQSTKEEIIKELDTVCTLMPGEYKGACENFVYVYSEEFISAFQQGLDLNELCQFIGVCMKKPFVPSSDLPSVKSDLPCELCLTLAKQLDDMITDQTTQAEIEAALDQVCELLPPNLKDTCDTLVAQYTPQLIDLLLQQVTPKKLCAELQLCPESHKVLKARSEVGCNLCTVVTTYLDDVIKSESTKEDVEAALDHVCALLPQKDADQCRTYVEVFAPELIDLLLQEESPKKICTQVGLCDVTQKAHVAAIQTEVKFGPVCAVCETVAAKLEDMLIGKVTKDSVEQALNKVCSLLPSSEEKACDNYVKMYSGVLVELLMSGVGPKLLCTSVGLCPMGAEKIAHEKMMKGEYCGICEMIAEKIESEVKDKTNEAQIEAALEQVCSWLPKSYKSQCDALVETYTPQIIQLLVDDVSPKEICTELGLCDALKSKVVPMTELQPSSKPSIKPVEKSPTVEKSLSCDLCHVVVQIVEDKITENATFEAIESHVQEVCKLLPAKVTSQCGKFVDG